MRTGISQDENKDQCKKEADVVYLQYSLIAGIKYYMLIQIIYLFKHLTCCCYWLNLEWVQAMEMNDGRSQDKNITKNKYDGKFRTFYNTRNLVILFSKIKYCFYLNRNDSLQVTLF